MIRSRRTHRGLSIALGALFGCASPAQAAWRTIHNDFYWADNNGSKILTRSGDLRKFGDTYYWYGGTQSDLHRAQTCYTSANLADWTSKGVVFRSPVETNRIDVVYNESTRLYVMVMKYDGNGAHLGFATSPTPDGQFTFKGQVLIDDAPMGDMSVYKDTDGKAYLCAVSWKVGTNRQHGIWLLSPDYLSVERRIFLWDIRSREAPNIFKRNGIYYYVHSETNGIESSPTRYYSATNLAGPWSAATMVQMQGSTNSWDSQCDLVLPIKGSQDSMFMYVGDRWVKPNALREGDYTWLPMTFNGNVPVVNYHQDWDLNLEAGTWRPFDGNSNLAKRKTATASSVNGANSANNVTDSATMANYATTRWESAAADPQWIMVDLGSAMAVNRVILKWHENNGRSFKIQVSNDATAWTDVYSTTAGLRRSVTDVAFTRATARYVRMYGTQRGGSNGYSLFDFMVLNDDSEPIPISDRDRPAPSMATLSWNGGVLSYSLPFASRAKLEAFDMCGKSIGIFADGYLGAGRHEAAFSGKAEAGPAGPYLFRLQAGGKNLMTMRTTLR
ncbi:MAG: discoidin domain-containing protein [Fibrobacteria bacterium]